jgi:serine protease inhibitor
MSIITGRIMKIKILWIATLIRLAGFHPALAAPAYEQQLSAANGDFAFRLLQQIEQEQPATNIFISPYSASTVLQIAGNGAAGQTKTEMQQVLGTTGLSSANSGEANQAIAQSLNTGNTNVILTTADAIWCRQGAPVNPDFITQNQLYFGATIGTLDFQSADAVKIINQWANDQTHGKICGLFQREMVRSI